MQIDMLHIIDKRAIYHPDASWRRVISREIPIARMVRAGSVKSFERLIDDFDLRIRPYGRQKRDHLV